MSDRRINVNIRLNADTWFRWKALCEANKVTLEQATEVLLQEALQRLGVDPKPEVSPAQKFTDSFLVRR